MFNTWTFAWLALFSFHSIAIRTRSSSNLSFKLYTPFPFLLADSTRDRAFAPIILPFIPLAASWTCDVAWWAWLNAWVIPFTISPESLFYRFVSVPPLKSIKGRTTRYRTTVPCSPIIPCAINFDYGINGWLDRHNFLSHAVSYLFYLVWVLLTCDWNIVYLEGMKC